MKREKLTPVEKAKRKQYLRLCKKHKKAIMQAAKKAATDPFDGEMGLEVMIAHMQFMYDYYALGYNVWAMESSKKSRKDSLAEALEEYKWAFDINNCLTEKYYFMPEAEVNLVDGKLVFPEGFGKPLNGMSSEEAAKAYNKEYSSHKRKFFGMLAKYLDDWWD